MKNTDKLTVAQLLITKQAGFATDTLRYLGRTVKKHPLETTGTVAGYTAPAAAVFAGLQAMHPAFATNALGAAALAGPEGAMLMHYLGVPQALGRLGRFGDDLTSKVPGLLKSVSNSWRKTKTDGLPAFGKAVSTDKDKFLDTLDTNRFVRSADRNPF